MCYYILFDSRHVKKTKRHHGKKASKSPYQVRARIFKKKSMCTNMVN